MVVKGPGDGTQAHENGDGCISHQLSHSLGSAATDDASNHLLQTTNASQGSRRAFLAESAILKVSEMCVCVC